MDIFYDVLPGADVGGQAGIAYVKNPADSNSLQTEGWIKEWQTKYFILKNGNYTDYLPAIGHRLCSEKMRNVLEECKSEKDILQWLDAEVESESGERRHYFVLHFPVLEDVLDKKKSKYVTNILTKKVVNPKLCIGHEVFSYIEGSLISFIISQKVRDELKKEDCRGLIYIKMTPEKKSKVPQVVQKLCQAFYPQKAQTVKKTSKQHKKNINCKQIEKLNLPSEFINFISCGKSFSYNEDKCKVGKVELVSIDRLFLGRIYVGPASDNHPNGYYTIPVVDLIKECEGFDSWGILVWLPDVQKFGTWDSDHRKLRIFQDTVWNDIEKDPEKYLNALWNPQEVKNKVFEPTDNYPFTEE